MAKLTDACAGCGHEIGAHFVTYDKQVGGCTGSVVDQRGSQLEEKVVYCTCEAPTFVLNMDSLFEQGRL